MNVDRSEGESLVAVLDELIELVSNAPTTVMSAAIKVNRSEILDLLATARDLVPDQIVRADGLLANADGFTHEAQARASRIVEQAQNDAEDTIAEAREQASSRRTPSPLPLRLALTASLMMQSRRPRSCVAVPTNTRMPACSRCRTRSPKWAARLIR